MSSIHGHRVIEMVMQSSQPYTKPALLAEIESTFGQDARFHTCSADNLTAEELIQFLENKGKFIISADGITMGEGHSCHH